MTLKLNEAGGDKQPWKLERKDASGWMRLRKRSGDWVIAAASEDCGLVSDGLPSGWCVRSEWEGADDSGIPLPPVPANPAVLSDITNAHDYIERLRSSRSSGHSHAATNDDVGAAEVFKTAVLFSHTPGPNAAPLWAAQLIATVDQIAANVAQLAPVIAPIPALVAGVAHIPVLVNSVDRLTERIQVLEQRVDELPIIFSNATAGPQGHAIQSITWMGSSIAGSLSQEQRRKCVNAAALLGLPPMDPGTPVLERRRQIAAKLGVSIDLYHINVYQLPSYMTSK
ncbi:hypothetical protein CPB84DRAFT_1749573 [Gymnopilus junonius]|uniref:Uncharacterized protein n=1 Tax=Gymnopilus junonius TaxID=109634 RepID=A0A9P5TKD0_GYMJU|nr:hypothetical protein CPB84DRAFT_1749573 [Gymnopilus junonius]